MSIMFTGESQWLNNFLFTKEIKEFFSILFGF